MQSAQVVTLRSGATGPAPRLTQSRQAADRGRDSSRYVVFSYVVRAIQIAVEQVHSGVLYSHHITAKKAKREKAAMAFSRSMSFPLPEYQPAPGVGGQLQDRKDSR
jgi:hypothetical protein